jgi:uncharacterized protein YutE (UPF0331/DUF86 family)
MSDSEQEVRIELDNIHSTLENLDKALNRHERDVVELAAIGAFLHNFYNGIENVLKRVVPQKLNSGSGSWHKKLLQDAYEAGVIGKDTLDSLFDFLGFRHVFSHGYTFFLKEDKLMALVDQIKPTFSRFKHDVTGYTGWSLD